MPAPSFLRAVRLPATLAAVATLGAVLAGCAQRPAPAPVSDAAAAQRVAAPPLTVQGTLGYQARVALPPQARVLVEVREGRSPDGVLVARQRLDLQGRQVPIGFAVDVPATAAASLAARPGALTLRAAVLVDEQARWASEPVALGRPEGEPPRLSLGAITLQPVRPQAFSAQLACGARQASVSTLLNEIVLRIDGRSLPLVPRTAGSGEAYAVVDDPRSGLHLKGQRALLTLDGRTLPECEVRMAQADPVRERAERLGERLYGRSWTVEQIDGAAVSDAARPTLNFDTQGRLWGQAGCNSYTAQAQISGETIRVSQAATTLRACTAQTGAQEAQFLTVLRNAQRIELTEDGALRLRADARHSLLARSQP